LRRASVAPVVNEIRFRLLDDVLGSQRIQESIYVGHDSVVSERDALDFANPVPGGFGIYRWNGSNWDTMPGARPTSRWIRRETSGRQQRRPDFLMAVKP
jgi:hypothetical protein